MSRGPHFNWYKSKIKQRYPLARTFMESGMLVEVMYVPEYSGSTNTYIALLLHKGSGIYRLTSKMKMHLLSLENLQPRIFNQLVGHVGLEFSTYFKNVRKLSLEKLLMEQRSAKRFYIKELKPHITTKFDDTYRTFNIGNVKRIKIIDFDFPPHLIPKTAQKYMQKKPYADDKAQQKFDNTGLKEE